MKILGQFLLIIIGWVYGLETNLNPISEEGKGVFLICHMKVKGNPEVRPGD
jgi:hypothetical protein